MTMTMTTNQTPFSRIMWLVLLCPISKADYQCRSIGSFKELLPSLLMIRTQSRWLCKGNKTLSTRSYIDMQNSMSCPSWNSWYRVIIKGTLTSLLYTSNPWSPRQRDNRKTRNHPPLYSPNNNTPTLSTGDDNEINVGFLQRATLNNKAYATGRALMALALDAVKNGKKALAFAKRYLYQGTQLPSGKNI